MKGTKIKATAAALLLLCALPLAACAQTSQSASTTTESSAGSVVESTQDAASEDSSETFTEGEDTPVEVSYAACRDDLKSLFLSKGDKVALIVPSGIPSQEQIDATLEGLKDWGYEPVLGEHVSDKVFTLEDSLADLTWALEDPSIKALFCVRGGYGASEVQDKLALDLIASSNKLIIGYSDIGAYHAAWTMSKVPSIHASMSATFDDLAKESVDVEQRILRGEIPSYTCENSGPYREGEAEGILIGGNLATFTSVLNTAYDSTRIDEPYILFLEDVNEDAQHIHRYLTTLKHLGVLDRAAGIVFGEWVDTSILDGSYTGETRGGTFSSIADMIERQFLSDLDAPVAFGLPAGHGEQNYPLLMGVKARLKVSADKFTLGWV